MGQIRPADGSVDWIDDPAEGLEIKEGGAAVIAPGRTLEQHLNWADNPIITAYLEARQ